MSPMLRRRLMQCQENGTTLIEPPDMVVGVLAAHPAYLQDVSGGCSLRSPEQVCAYIHNSTACPEVGLRDQMSFLCHEKEMNSLDRDGSTLCAVYLCCMALTSRLPRQAVNKGSTEGKGTASRD